MELTETYPCAGWPCQICTKKFEVDNDVVVAKDDLHHEHVLHVGDCEDYMWKNWHDMEFLKYAKAVDPIPGVDELHITTT